MELVTANQSALLLHSIATLKFVYDIGSLIFSYPVMIMTDVECCK